MRDGFEESSKMSPEYRRLLEMAKGILPEGVVQTIEIDGHGLLLDCEYVGVFGNYTFFKDTGFQYRFDNKLEAALELAVRQGYATERSGFDPVDFDYESIAKSAGIPFQAPLSAELPDVGGDPFHAVVQKGTLASFPISFEPNQVDFPKADYGTDFQHAVEQASLAPTAVILVRGHSDPTQTLLDLLGAGMAKGVIRRIGKDFALKTAAGWKPLDLTQTENLVAMIKAGELEGVAPSPMARMQAALTLSDTRAKKVQEGIIAYAKQEKISMNPNQIQAVGVGILDPVVAKPTTKIDRAMNRRVEVSVVKVSGEMASEEDVEY